MSDQLITLALEHGEVPLAMLLVIWHLLRQRGLIGDAPVGEKKCSERCGELKGRLCKLEPDEPDAEPDAE